MEDSIRRLKDKIGAAIRLDERARRDLVEAALDARGAVDIAIQRLETDWTYSRMILDAVQPIGQYVPNYFELYDLMNEDTK